MHDRPWLKLWHSMQGVPSLADCSRFLFLPCEVDLYRSQPAFFHLYCNSITRRHSIDEGPSNFDLVTLRSDRSWRSVLRMNRHHAYANGSTAYPRGSGNLSISPHRWEIPFDLRYWQGIHMEGSKTLTSDTLWKGIPTSITASPETAQTAPCTIGNCRQCVLFLHPDILSYFTICSSYSAITGLAFEYGGPSARDSEVLWSIQRWRHSKRMGAWGKSVNVCALTRRRITSADVLLSSSKFHISTPSDRLGLSRFGFQRQDTTSSIQNASWATSRPGSKATIWGDIGAGKRFWSTSESRRRESSWICCSSEQKKVDGAGKELASECCTSPNT